MQRLQFGASRVLYLSNIHNINLFMPSAYYLYVFKYRPVERPKLLQYRQPLLLMISRALTSLGVMPVSRHRPPAVRGYWNFPSRLQMTQLSPCEKWSKSDCWFNIALHAGDLEQKTTICLYHSDPSSLVLVIYFILFF